MYNARVTVRDAEGRADNRWLPAKANITRCCAANRTDMTDRESISACRHEGERDWTAPHPFFRLTALP